jgi:hypothetical protein
VSLQEVHAAVAEFLERPLTPPQSATAPADAKSVRQTWTRDELAPQAKAPAALPLEGPEHDELDVKLTLAIGQCRSARQPLSVVVVGVESPSPLAADQARTVDRLLEATCRGATRREGAAPGRVLLLVGRDRQEAIAAARTLVEKLKQLVEPLHRAGQLAACVVAAGVASVVEPPKNFHGGRLLETAQRCLAAALASGGVKSLEVI